MYPRQRLRWMTPLTRLWPNRPLASLTMIVLLVEACLLARSTDSIYVAGGFTPALAVVYLVWFWYLVSWSLFGGGALLARLCEDRKRLKYLATYAALGGILAATFAVTIVSWGLFFRSGRFANLEGLLFILRNPLSSTWLHMAPGERTSTSVLAAVTLGLFLFAPKLLQIGSRVQHAPKSGADKPGNFGFTFRCLSIVLVMLGLWVIRDPSPQRSAQRLAVVNSSMHPSMTLVASSVSYFLREPIEACLDPTELTSITKTPWTPLAAKPRPSVIFIAIESLRHDVVHLVHQGREVTPHLNALTRNGIQWTKAYSQSTHSDYADVCIVSSLYPLRTRNHHYYRAGDPWPKTLAFDVFKRAGYDTAIISSQNEAWGGMDQFLQTDSLDLFYDSNRSKAPTYTSEKDPGFAYERSVGTFLAGSLYDDHTMDTAIAWIEQRFQQATPFFLSMNFQSSHFPYELPEGTDQPFQPCELDSDVSFMNYPHEKTDNVRNAYYNGIHNCDLQLGRLVETLRRAGKLDEVILVVLGENGEAFHENGSVGHAREPVEPAIHVATVMHAPQFLKPRVEDYPLEHIDLLPTILGMLDWPRHPNFQGIDLLDNERPPLEQRLLYFHVNSPAANADAVQWAGRWKYVLDHRTGIGRLFDLQSDPEESKDLASEHTEIAGRLSQAVRGWRKRQLAYYHFPTYYRTYYPPAPPRLPELGIPRLIAADGQ